jgi:hypothetical protein
MKNQGMYIRHPKARGEWAEMRFMIVATEKRLCVTKPWGEIAPFDLATEYRGRFKRVQVKCTLCKRRNSYVCCIAPNRTPYRVDQIDFIAAFVIPTDTWYIIPIRATHGQNALVLSPHLEESKYSKYREAWHLLKR